MKEKRRERNTYVEMMKTFNQTGNRVKWEMEEKGEERREGR